MARAWYNYNGGSVSQPSSYTLTTVAPSCVNGTPLCAIYALDGGQNPSTISSHLQTYISNAGVSGLAQPQIPVGTKKYVYLKQS